MKTPVDMGMNKTGAGLHPRQTQEMIEAAEGARVPPGDETAMAEVRAGYSGSRDVIGTMPPPASVKGAAKTAMKAATGKKATVFIDKLAERMAFERTGTRLYEAIRAKLAGLGGGDGIGLYDARLREIQNQETAHMELLYSCIEKLGADPTTETPSADVAGVQSLGILQVLTDPRTTISQCLNALLTAELVDNASWELLIELADEMGQQDMVNEFRIALQEEQHHLDTVRNWVVEASRKELHGHEVVA